MPSQVIPYLRELSKGDYIFTLLTFEKKWLLKAKGKEEIKKIKEDLRQMGIDWHWLKYHKRISMLATLFDILVGSAYVSYLVIVKGIRLIHARSVVPATMSLIPKLLGAKLIFDTRGLLAEEYVGGRHWKEGGLAYRVTKVFEKICLRMSNAIVILTYKHRDYLLNLSWFKAKEEDMKLEVIPCCVDLRRFKYKFSIANAPKREGHSENDFIFSYLGKIGKHYMMDEMLDFLKIAFHTLPNSKFTILTTSEQQHAWNIVSRKKLNSDRISIKKPTFEEIPDLVSRAHAGVFFINPYKKFGSCPIKLGEFLSCGVPVIINNGIGDTEELVKQNKVGVSVDKFNTKDYENKLYEFLELIKEGEELNKRCRRTAEQHLSLELGVERYEKVYKGVRECIT